MKSHHQKTIYLIIGVFVVATFSIASDYSGGSWAKGQSLSDQYFEEREKWQHSHHQKSMLLASTDTILGDFENTTVTINDKTTRFFKKGEEFWVHTDDIIGTPQEFKIEYTFGFDPLQQYLVKTNDGKYQILPVSWDTRPAARGGQRWFHIYGDDHIKPNERLHWTGPLQNWNGMCADCHSTGLTRDYDAASDQFNSEWQTVNVSCKSCHVEDGYSDFSNSTATEGWVFKENAVTAQWSGETRANNEIEVCAACHSLRTPITDGIDPSKAFLDQFTPTLIQSPQYFPDGQVKEEDYVWGSFLQSKMYSKGVICSDCHDPHSLELKAPGNQICTTCHLPSKFDVPSHHNHQIGSTGSMCVNCHMPETTFMQVDARNDHSFRIPRPDLSHQTESPDACTGCHQDMTPDDAAANITKWFGSDRVTVPHFGETFSAVLTNEPGSESRLKSLLKNREMPPIVRASAYAMLDRFPNPDTFSHIEDGLKSSDPLIRLAAINSAHILPPNLQVALITPLLQDELKAVRIAAFDQIGDPNLNTTIKREYDIAAEQTMWRGEGRYNLALFHQRRGNSGLATELYLSSQQIDPYFSASYVNLADLLRSSSNERMSGQIIDRGLNFMPDDPALNFSKALHLVRDQNAPEALAYLDKAVNFAPDNSRYAYTYGVALSDLGQPNKAIEVLSAALQKDQYNQDINAILLNLNRAQGNWNEALKYAINLSKLLPDNETIDRIISDLQNKTGN